MYKKGVRNFYVWYIGKQAKLCVKNVEDVLEHSLLTYNARERTFSYLIRERPF